MIKPVTMYTVVCDRCGKDAFADEEYGTWYDKRFAEDFAIEKGWHEENYNHYCPDCYEVDDDGEIVVKPIQNH